MLRNRGFVNVSELGTVWLYRLGNGGNVAGKTGDKSILFLLLAFAKLPHAGSAGFGFD
jgi:hypothetical protein